MFLKKKIVIIFLLIMPFVSAGAVQWSMFAGSTVLEKNDKTMDLEILVNGNSRIKMKNVPTEGYLEVYSIIGVRITRVNLKQYINADCNLDLPKGVFIFKAGKVAQKVFVK